MKLESCHYITEHLTEMMVSGIDSIRKVSLCLVILFYSINLIYEYTRLEFIGKPTAGALKSSFFNAAFVVLFLVFYKEIIMFIEGGLVNPITKFIYRGNIFNREIGEAAQKHGSVGLFSMLVNMAFSAFLDLILEGGLAEIVHMCKDYTILLLLIGGPFSVAASLLPSAGGIFKFWFKTLISVFCWSITLALLDAILWALYADTLEKGERSIWPYMALAAMYFKVPSITSMFTNTMGTGSALSSITTMVGMAKTVAHTASSMGASAGKGAASLGSRAIRSLSNLPRTK